MSDRLAGQHMAEVMFDRRHNDLIAKIKASAERGDRSEAMMCYDDLSANVLALIEATLDRYTEQNNT